MKKLIMMLLGVAFATCAWADSSQACFKEYSAVDKEPADANAAWYSCYYLSPSAIKTATAGQVTSVDCDGYSAWLQVSYADNKAATIANASMVVQPVSVEYFMEQYYLEHKWVEPTESTEFLAICFFEHGKDQAFKVIQMDDVAYGCDDDRCVADTGWIATSAEPQDPIDYLTWDADAKEMVATNTTSYTVMTKDTATFEDKKWYVVTNTIERAGIKVNGAAHLILCDGASLKVTGADNEAGIEVPEDKRLAIYGQSTGDLVGQLIANGGVRSAGIGGKRKGTCGTITINGGKIKATGGMNGAGIGGGNHCSTAATITINGGNVEAIGGSEGAGIGSGNYYQYNGSRSGTDVITINGGTITATGGKWGAGIGSGNGGLAATVAINGGTITASTQEADAIGSGDAAKAATTVTFAEGVEFSIEAGAEEASATAMTVADYVANHSARYVKIVQGLFPTVTLDEIIEGEDWTKFDVAYTLENLEEGVDYKVLIEVTAGGKTKSITNGTDIVNRSFTNTVDTVKLFGGKVFDEKAKVKVSLGTWKELKWTQLWEKGPYFAEYNVGAKKPEDAGKTYTFDEAQKALTAPMRLLANGEITTLDKTVNVTWDGDKNGVNITGLDDYESNSIFLPAASDYWTSTAYSTGVKAYYFGVRENAGSYYVTQGSDFKTDEYLVRAVVDPKDVDSVKYIFDPVSTAEETVELLAPPVEYLNWDGAKFVTATNRTYDVVTAETARFEDGWYIVTNTIERAEIEVKGAAHLILCDGAKLKVIGEVLYAGIAVNDAGSSLTIYSQSTGEKMGALEAKSARFGAGIGGGNKNACGTITINGGNITATGVDGCAGIGSGSRSTNAAAVTINGGVITASSDNGEAIGSGKDASFATTVTFGAALANRYVWAGASATACEGMTTAAFASDHSVAYVELPVDCYTVTYDGNGAAGEMTNSIFAVGRQVSLKANSYGILGYNFDGWTTNGVEEVVYADKATGTDFVAKDETLELTAKWTVSTDPIVPEDYDDITNMFTKVVYPVMITLTNDVVLASGDNIVVPEKVALATDGGQFDVSAIVPQFGTPVVVGEGFADESALALFDTKDVSKLVFEEGTVSIVARGETEDFPWILDAETKVTVWVDPSLTNLAAVVIANGPAADAEIDLVALTNNLEVYGYTPEVTPLNALVKVEDESGTAYLIPTGWIGAKGTYATLEAALAAGETTVVPNFVTEEIPAVIAEYGTAADGNVYTAVVANDPGAVTNAIQAVAAEGLLALATNELANVRLVVAAEAAAEVAAEEEKIALAITNDIPAVAGMAVDYVDLSVYFDDVPQTALTQAIGVCIPWTLDPQRDYAVARVHNGAAEKLPVGAENAVDGEYVEFTADGLVVHTKKFSLYAIGEITPFTTVTVPTGLEGYSYVVSNLTAGVEMTIDSTVDGGVTYKLQVGSKVSITCVPEEGYVIDGETTFVIESVTKETTLADVTLPVAREDDLLYPKGDGNEFVAAVKSVETFNGTIFGEDGVEGVITLKMTKPNKRTNLFNVQATVKTLVDKASYSFQAKKVAVPETGVLTIELVGKSKQSSNHRLVVVLDGDSLTGAFDDWAIDGARDVFGIKNHPKRTALEPLVGTWTGILAGEDEKTVGAFFSVKITKMARASVKVVAADGKAMSCSTKVEIGADGRGVVPVTVSWLSGGVRTSIGFRILFRQTAEGIVAKAVNVTPVRQWSKKTGLTTVSTLAFVGAEKLTVTAKQFRTDYVMKLAPTYAEVLGDPASETLKLDAYGRITGTIKWKVPYLDVHGHERIKSVSGKVTGIMVGDTGLGTVAVKLPTGERVAIDLELQKE